MGKTFKEKVLFKIIPVFNSASQVIIEEEKNYFGPF